MERDLTSDNPRLHHECYSDVRISKLYSLFESGVEYSEGMTLHEFPPEWMNGVGAEVANAVPEGAGQSSASRKRGSTEQASGQPLSKLSRYVGLILFLFVLKAYCDLSGVNGCAFGVSYYSTR